MIEKGKIFRRYLPAHSEKSLPFTVPAFNKRCRAKIEYCIQQIWRLLLVAWIEADNSSIMPQHCVTSVIHFVIHSASSTVKRIHLQWRKKYYSTATEFFETKLGILSLSVLIESLNVKVSLLHSQIPP